MKKQFMGILLTLCMVLTLLPTTAFAADTALPKQNLYQVGSNPAYRSSPNGDIIGEMPSGTILEVTQIKGDWAKVKYEGKEYYMWAARLIKVAPAQTYQDGWYEIDSSYGEWDKGNQRGGIKIMVDFDGGAVVTTSSRTITVNRNFYLKNVGNNQITLRMLDGTYLGISGEIKNGIQLKAVKDPYPWNMYSSSDNARIVSFRLPSNTNMVVNLSGNKTTDSTPIILWEHSDTPDTNAWFIFQTADDWTKPVTRGEMAKLLTMIMSDGSGESDIKYLPPGRGGSEKTMYNGLPEDNKYRGSVARLRYWGILPVEKFDENVQITYGEFTKYLIKLMDYYNNIGDPGMNHPFLLTKDTIKNFALENYGQNTDPNAKITMWHAKMLSHATVLWMYSISGSLVHGEKVPLPFPYPDGKLRANTPTLKAGVNILSYPKRTKYTVGDGFDPAGLKAVNYAEGKQTNINSKITFYTSKTVQLTKGCPFTTTGKKVVEVRYKGKKVATYTIYVSAKKK